MATSAKSDLDSPKAKKRPRVTSPSKEDFRRKHRERERKLKAELAASLPPDLTKSQRKKKLKQLFKEKMKAEWRKMKRERDKKAGKKRERMRASRANPPTDFRVAIDMSYDDLMDDKAVIMLMKQCQRCYAQNRRAEKPVQLYCTGFKGRSKARLESYASGYRSWDIKFKEENLLEVFKKEEIVYLAAESPNVLNELDPKKVYVIGGLVDHNRYKGHCFQKAVENGVEHAQLPISDYVTLNSRKVLTVNHVFEILLAYLQLGDWKEAFLKVIPRRKVATEGSHSATPSSSQEKTQPETASVDTKEAVVADSQRQDKVAADHSSRREQRSVSSHSTSTESSST